MEIVLGTYHLGLGGTESYTLTIAEQLRRLGHGVTIFGVDGGPAVEVARERGLPLVLDERGLPAVCDIVFAQDAAAAYLLTDRFPKAPLVVSAHADEYDLFTPPQLPGLVQAIVVLHERMARHVRSLAVVPDVVRLRQPIDVKRFYPRAPLPRRPKRALLLGNWVQEDRRRLVLSACAAAGIECRELGAMRGVYTRQPEVEIASVDIVFGKARVIVEAMACGRAAYVFDHNGGDGWVTPDRYELLEADNFGGQAEAVATDAARLSRDLAAYDAAMGAANRDLAVANHSASRHGHELVALFRTLAPRAEPVNAPTRELARLAQLQWVNEVRAVDLANQVLQLRAQIDVLKNPRVLVPYVARKGARRVRKLLSKEESAHSV